MCTSTYVQSRKPELDDGCLSAFSCLPHNFVMFYLLQNLNFLDRLRMTGYWALEILCLSIPRFGSYRDPSHVCISGFPGLVLQGPLAMPPFDLRVNYLKSDSHTSYLHGKHLSSSVNLFYWPKLILVWKTFLIQLIAPLIFLIEE